jgi:hypothetical protein
VASSTVVFSVFAMSPFLATYEPSAMVEPAAALTPDD